MPRASIDKKRFFASESSSPEGPSRSVPHDGIEGEPKKQNLDFGDGLEPVMTTEFVPGNTRTTWYSKDLN